LFPNWIIRILAAIKLAISVCFLKVSDRIFMHMNCFAGILAQAAPATSTTAAPQSSLVMQLAPMVLIGVVFYFLLIRPQQQRAKQQKKLLEALKAGDKVATASGIIGTVITVKDRTVSLRSADAKFEILKSAVTEILQGSDVIES
jgi:preprotein translocase subunit YajC